MMKKVVAYDYLPSKHAERALRRTTSLGRLGISLVRVLLLSNLNGAGQGKRIKIK